MGIELTFRGEESADGSDDLGSLYRHLAGDHELERHVGVRREPEPAKPGELGGIDTVLAVVATAAAVGDLALSVQSWVASRTRRPAVRLEVPEEHQEVARPVQEALTGPGGGREAVADDEPAASAVVRPGRIDPETSACVLIGVDRYDDKNLDSIRAVYNNLTHLQDVLTDESIWGIKPGRLRVVRNPETPQELIRPIRQMAELARDTLIVYYAGHGLKELDEDELYLTLPGSVPGQEETSVRYAAVKSAIRQSRRARRVVIILDCCYSGKAIEGGMSRAADGIREAASLSDVRGSYLMASAASNRRALAPRRDDCTVFTGAFVDVLRSGVPEEPGDMLGLGVLFREVRNRLRAARRPEPQEQDLNQVGELAFVRNRAKPRPVPVGEVVQVPARRGRRRVLAAALIVLAFAGGLGVLPGLEWWRRLTPVPASGTCSSHAELLSYSDLLDKTEVRGEKVVDLSALALTDPSHALALGDNLPARVFPLSLGNPDALSPAAMTGRTLRHVNGTQFAAGFDGEGLVVENGTGTILVSSEVGPSIRRFRIDTGQEVGDPLPIPKPLRTRPDGEAQSGRTIEALAATPDGQFLYAGWESPISEDGDSRGRNLIRIQRYQGVPGGAYVPDRQYAYQTGEGLHLVELAVVGEDRLVTLERQFVRGLGNAIRVYDVSLAGAADVTNDESLFDDSADVFVESRLLFDLADCPAGDPGQVASREDQPNPLLGNVEGMAVTDQQTTGPHRGSRLLYLVTDDNDNPSQITRLYAFEVDLP
jgi:hypothetical protein